MFQCLIGMSDLNCVYIFVFINWFVSSVDFLQEFETHIQLCVFRFSNGRS